MTTIEARKHGLLCSQATRNYNRSLRAFSVVKKSKTSSERSTSNDFGIDKIAV